MADANADVLPGILGSVENTWDRLRADLLSHGLLGTLLFGWLGVPLPTLALPKVDPQRVLSSPWFALAEKTSLLVLVPIGLVAAVFIYGLVVRLVGRFVVSIVTTLWSSIFPRITSPVVNEFVPWDSLVTIAATFGGDDLTDNALANRLWYLERKYTIIKKAELSSALQFVDPRSAASTYVVNSGFFLVAWLATFAHFPSDSPWIKAAAPHFFSGTTFLVLLFAWACYRSASAAPLRQGARAIAVAACIASDPDFERPDAARRQALRLRLEALERGHKAFDARQYRCHDRMRNLITSLFGLVVFYLRGAPLSMFSGGWRRPKELR